MKFRNWFSWVVQNIEWMNNAKIANFWSETFIFQKISKFLNFPIWAIPTICNFANLKKIQFGKTKKKSIYSSKNFQFGKFQKLSIWKIRRMYNFWNSKNLQFKKFEKFSILKTPKWFEIFQFGEITNFKNTKIWKTINIPWIYNFINYHIFWKNLITHLSFF